MRALIHSKILFVFAAIFFLKPEIKAQVTFQSASPFPFGASVNINLLKNNATYRGVLTREYNSVTAENAMKMDAIHPAQNTYNWVDADTLVNYAQQSGKRVYGHVLIWHNQVPSWVTNFSGDSAAWENIMKTHIQTVVTHYAGRIVAWDVVNEAFKDDGSLRNTGSGGSIWMQHLGPNYIARAFQYAHEADPSALLFYNDYGHDYSMAKLNAINTLVTNLKNAGVPIHGVGLQMHIDKNTSYLNLANAINVMTQTGLKVHFSELDVSLNPENNQSATFNATLSQLQTHTYKFVTRYYRTKVPVSQQFGITTWNVGDADTWIRPVFGRPDWPLPFDDNYDKKMAYQGIIDGLTGSFDFTASTSQSLSTVYTDLGTNGTPITTNFGGSAMTTDADNSSVQNIGFNFMYNGTSYTNFILNTNGYIKFGVNIASPGLFYSTATRTTGSAITATDIDLLYPYNHDLMGMGATEYRVYTSGAAGSRICTIQFKNVVDKLAPTQYANMNFQIKLYEVGNIVEFVYGTWTPGSNGASSITAALGIKGIYDSSVNLAKGAATAWSTTPGQANNLYFINGNYTGTDPTFNTMNSVLPDAGRTFRFTPNQTILPLSMLRLSAIQKKSGVNIDWVTSNEVNTSNFEVQRSANGSDFISIGIVSANGNNNISDNHYTFTDATLAGMPPTLYYRLLQHDKDGKTKISNIIIVRRDNKESLSVNVVNPIKDNIDMRLQTATPGKVSIYILNLSGAVIMKKNVSVAAGSSSISLSGTNAFTKGVYILKVIKDNEERAIKLTRQ